MPSSCKPCSTAPGPSRTLRSQTLSPRHPLTLTLTLTSIPDSDSICIRSVSTPSSATSSRGCSLHPLIQRQPAAVRALRAASGRPPTGECHRVREAHQARRDRCCGDHCVRLLPEARLAGWRHWRPQGAAVRSSAGAHTARDGASAFARSSDGWTTSCATELTGVRSLATEDVMPSTSSTRQGGTKSRRSPTSSPVPARYSARSTAVPATRPGERRGACPCCRPSLQ